MCADHKQLHNNIFGVSVAMVGVILYGHLKQVSGQHQDCFDFTCPGPLLGLLESDAEKREKEAIQKGDASGV